MLSMKTVHHLGLAAVLLGPLVGSLSAATTGTMELDRSEPSVATSALPANLEQMMEALERQTTVDLQVRIDEDGDLEIATEDGFRVWIREHDGANVFTIFTFLPFREGASDEQVEALITRLNTMYGDTFFATDGDGTLLVARRLHGSQLASDEAVLLRYGQFLATMVEAWQAGASSLLA